MTKEINGEVLIRGSGDDGSVKSKIVDENGTIVSVKNNVNTTNNELLVNLEDHQCPGNTTLEQLEADEFFLGSTWQDTLDYGVLSINISSDQDSAIDGLEIQWSNDGITISDYDKFTIIANNPKTFTFGPAERYYRVKYINGSDGTTTKFHLTSLLRRVYVKPSSHRITDSIVGEDDAELVKSVLSGVNPDGIFTNVETTYDNSLKTSLIDGETGSRAEIEPLGALKTIIPVRLVGTTFSNGTKDPNFWTEAVTGSGTVTQLGKIVLNTGTTADSTAKYYTISNARKITGTANQFRCISALTTEPQENNIRRIGAYNTNDGFFFQINGTTMQVASRKNTVDTPISNGSFNGNYGLTWTPELNTLYRLVITYTSGSAKFFVNGKLLHTILNTTDGFTNTQNFPVSMENINSGGNTTDNEFNVAFATILRLGEISTAPKSYYQSGTTAGVVLKYNAGALRGGIVSGVANNSVITLYDNTAASGTILWSSGAMGSQTQPFELDFKSLGFSTGLTLVISGANSNITVVYE